jgi:hypothetical protein
MELGKQITKKCTTCNCEKPLTEFHKRKDCKDGLKSACRECLNKISSKYREKYKNENIKNDNLSSKERHESNNEKRIRNNNYKYKWMKNNPYLMRKFRKTYSEKHKEEIRNREREYRLNLTDGYIIKKLSQQLYIKSAELYKYPELIEIKKIMLKTKRLCKTLENSDKV